MAVKRAMRVACAVLALVSAIALVIELGRWFDRRAYNEAVTQGRYDAAAEHAGEYGIFAGAFAAQSDKRYQEARVLYSGLEHADDERLRIASLFNTGNTYMQQASALDRTADSDLAHPLIELAKASYREVLAADPAHWAARYNLERALQWLPDLQEHALMEVEGRRGAVRTIISRDPEDNLP